MEKYSRDELYMIINMMAMENKKLEEKNRILQNAIDNAEIGEGPLVMTAEGIFREDEIRGRE